MVVGVIVGIVAIVIGAAIFQPQIKDLFGAIIKKSPEQVVREERGAIANTTAFIFGEAALQNRQTIDSINTFNASANSQKLAAAKSLGFSSIREFEARTDTNATSIDKFNPKGTVGFGILSINSGKGIADTPDNRILVANAQEQLTLNRIGRFRTSRFGSRR